MAEDEALAVRGMRKRGGRITLPFIIVTKLAVGIAATGVCSNLTVFLIQQFNIRGIDAAQINSFATGTSQFAPVVASIVSDAGLGCFSVICAATLASFLGSLLFLMISLYPSLRPTPCLSDACVPPTAAQLALLYSAIVLVLAGSGSARFISGAFGSEQSDDADMRATFFNWFVVCEYASSLFGQTVIVYVQDRLGWTQGYSFSLDLFAVGLAALLLGTRYYRYPKSQTNSSPASIEQQALPLLHHSSDDLLQPCNKEEEASRSNVSFLIRLAPLILSSMAPVFSLSILSSLTVLQALVMDRRLGHHFIIPASSMPVFLSLATILSVPTLERVLFPLCARMSGRGPTLFQRIGVGFFVNTLASAAAAIVEARRLKGLEGSGEPMPVLWLAPGLVLLGLGEALQFPAGLAFYHEEMPNPSSSLVMGVLALVVAVGYYTSVGLLAVVRKITPWLQDDVNSSRLDNVYWLLTVLGALNFGYFLICAKLYKRR